MKVFALLCCLVLSSLVVGEDVQGSSCNATDVATSSASECGVSVMYEWETYTLYPTNTSACASATYAPEDIDSVFVLAIRPGEDGTGNTTIPIAYALASNGLVQTPVSCVQVQEGQQNDDMDYSCADSTPFSSGTTYYVQVTGQVEVETQVQVYVGFAEGSASSCSTSYVSSSGSSAFYYFLIAAGVAIVLVLIIGIIVALIGGLIYLKKKKSAQYMSYD